ncbi:HelD family protein [Streptacidiphilus fuscans]|uniref:AAA family ATPase n=1 Tax=Streptacidiphilus fuscans TaxID=2789292 RepID=A0A931B1B5_9ACTN|nr:ATP-binding domain-containing protein [Streptacidiphilus fuscans]MBF9069355.1 AAA family ATPase [Streptacidiphilus fuscans]
MRREQDFLDRLRARVVALETAAGEAVSAALRQDVISAQSRLERDVMVAEQSGLLAAFASGEEGLCFGRLVFQDGGDHHIGRIGIRADDDERTPLVVDWRADMARPFYLATGHTPMGLRRRRHITTHRNQVTALHDEILDLEDTERSGYEGSDADAVLLSALDAARTGRMHDIVQTIQADQDRIIRAPHQGVMVVEGGPGTGKTAVALHRAAYLLYAQRELLARRAVLIVGPNAAFLSYIGQVLPSLGETGVLLATPAELYPGVVATGRDTPLAAAVKGGAAMADALAAHLRDLQRLPEQAALVIEHEDGVLLLDRQIAAAARERARAAQLPHNLARPHFAFSVIDQLTAQLVERIGADPYGGPNLLGPDDQAQLGKAVATSPAVHAAIEELWPLLTPEQLVADFLADPTHLPHHEAEAIRRPDPSASVPPQEPDWTPADVALLDEAAELLGDDDSARRAAEEARRQQAIAYAQGVLDLSYGSRTLEFEDKDEEDSEVLAAHDLIDAERLADRQEELDHRSAAERAAADRTWAFGHIIVDEAQELSPMLWRLLMRRCPTRSMTLVGDPAQTSEPGGCGSWDAALTPHVGDRWQRVVLDVNYRTPAEIMDVAARIPQATDPAYTPPRSVRSTGVPPRAEHVADTAALPAAVARVVAEEQRALTGTERRLAVIATPEHHATLLAELPMASAATGSLEVTPDLTQPVVLLTPGQAKGLEFDAVVVVEPDGFGANELYVALTRATQRLAVVHADTLPHALAPALTEPTRTRAAI